MQEIKKDDLFELTDYEDAVKDSGSMTEALAKALAKAENKAVALHKPGPTVTDKKGISHKVNKQGDWKKVRGNR